MFSLICRGKIFQGRVGPNGSDLEKTEIKRLMYAFDTEKCGGLLPPVCPHLLKTLYVDKARMTV